MATNQDRFWGIVHLSVAVVQSIICLGCLLYTLYVDCINRDYARSGRSPYRFEIVVRYPKFISWSRCIAILSFLLSSIARGIDLWLFYNSPFSDTQILPGYVSNFCWGYGQCCSYLVFLFRLIDVFSASAVAIPRTVIFYMGTLIMFIGISWNANLVIGCLNRYGIDVDNLKPIYIYSFYAGATFELILTVSMTYQFITRLFFIMRKQFGNGHDRYKLMESDTRSLHLFYLCVKVAVLSITSLSSSFIYYALDVVSAFYGYDHSMDVARDLWFQLDNSISSLCLVLFLNSSRNWYRRLCCCCAAVCGPCIKRQFLKSEDWNISTFKASRAIPNDHDDLSLANNLSLQNNGSREEVMNGNGMSVPSITMNGDDIGIEHESEEAGSQIPSKFVCYITKKLMREPVMAFDGYTYEKSAIEQYLRKHKKSPRTKKQATTLCLFPNIQLQQEIETFCRENGIEFDAEELIYEHDVADGRFLFIGRNLRSQFIITKITRKKQNTMIYYNNNGRQMETHF